MKGIEWPKKKKKRRPGTLSQCKKKRVGDLEVRDYSYIKVVEIQNTRDMRIPALTVRDAEITRGSVYKVRLALTRAQRKRLDLRN